MLLGIFFCMPAIRALEVRGSYFPVSYLTTTEHRRSLIFEAMVDLQGTDEVCTHSHLGNFVSGCSELS